MSSPDISLNTESAMIDLSGKQHLLPTEDSTAFDLFRQSLVDEYVPITSSTLALTHQAAAAHWSARRYEQFSTHFAGLVQHGDTKPETIRSLREFQQMKASEERNYLRMTAVLRKLRDQYFSKSQNGEITSRQIADTAAAMRHYPTMMYNLEKAEFVPSPLAKSALTICPDMDQQPTPAPQPNPEPEPPIQSEKQPEPEPEAPLYFNDDYPPLEEMPVKVSLVLCHPVTGSTIVSNRVKPDDE